MNLHFFPICLVSSGLFSCPHTNDCSGGLQKAADAPMIMTHFAALVFVFLSVKSITPYPEQ
jgi:hypothetical protein